jgi:addiction module RelE/StbE family toxin
MAQVRWSPQVAQDLKEICDYIGRDSPRYAALFAERVFTVVEMIAQFPLAGGIVPEYGRDDVRERLIHNYRLVYRLRGGDTIQLVTLIHGARILPPLSE